MLLAKSKPERSLLHHTLDVATMAQQYAKQWAHLADLINDEHLFDDLILAALLHDLGKTASGFQSILKGKADDSWQHYRHEILSAALAATLPYSQRRQDLLLAIMTHHMGLNDELGRRKALSDYDPQNDPLTPFSERLEQLKPYWNELKALMKKLKAYGSKNVDWPQLPNEPLELPNPFKALKESQEPQPSRRSRKYRQKNLPLRQIFLRGLLVGADHLASAAVTEANAKNSNIVSQLPKLHSITTEVFPFELNDHQKACAQAKGSIFLNAPTGSGKTEASLLWMQTNQPSTGLRHVFYGLPFTASINAMYHRLKSELLFGDKAVSLLHGRSSYFTYRWLCESDSNVDPKKASKVASALRQQTKELYYPIKVLTPHQILMAFLGVKGWEKSLCEYAGGLFILDEIHAYDPKFTGLLFEVLRRLTQELAAKVCIMSATFPTLLKKVLVEHIGDVTDVTLKPNERNKYNRHFIKVVEGNIEDYLSEIIEKLDQGLRVLVVLNTVKGAMACFNALRNSAKNACLIHGRLILKDRQNAEMRLSDKDSPVDLLVGTQAIEVSLDVDFDVLYSDPAPLDALLQRFGRVNRKPLHKLEHLPSNVRYREVIVCQSQWSDTPAIYDRTDAGKRLIGRTLETLPKSEILSETNISEMIDTVYDEEQLQSFLEIANKKTAQLKRLIDRLEPGNEKPFDENDILDIDSIPIVPSCFSKEHKQCIESKHFFDAQDFQFSISTGRYHALKSKAQIQSEVINGQKFYYGEFTYEEGIGPDFDVVKHMETEIW